MTNRRLFIACIAILLAGIVLCVALAAAASAEDCTGPQCCGCEPGIVAEPAPLRRIYLPSVQRSMPPMAAEFTPVHPAPTVTPEVSGDVAR